LFASSPRTLGKRSYPSEYLPWCSCLPPGTSGEHRSRELRETANDSGQPV
jgi:hypothetical protein